MPLIAEHSMNAQRLREEAGSNLERSINHHVVRCLESRELLQKAGPVKSIIHYLERISM